MDAAMAIRREVERLAQAVLADARCIATASREGTSDDADALSLELHTAQLRATRQMAVRYLWVPKARRTSGHINGHARHNGSTVHAAHRFG